MPLARHDVAQHFSRQFGQAPQWVVRAPGRVNLIGEHTDYNDGFVLPLAIDRAAWIGLRGRSDRRVVVHSIDYGETREFDLDRLEKTDVAWVEYLKGVASVLAEAGLPLAGWEGVMGGDVPIGAGLSSSAALEMATARAFAAVAGFPWDAPKMALLGQRAENRWIGVQCGIMDQLISATGRDGHAVLIDCRCLELRAVPLPSETAVVVLDTGTRRGLVDSAYNERRSQCQEAARVFGVRALRDVSQSAFQAREEQLDATTRRRARHVITENDRTLQAAEALQAGQARVVGSLMRASHASLRDDYEVSSPALNAIVEIADRHPACVGARMTGAGFGGCAVALVLAEQADAFARDVASAYQTATSNTPAVYVCRATGGAAVV